MKVVNCVELIICQAKKGKPPNFSVRYLETTVKVKDSVRLSL